ncbi:MAG: protein-export chaperone SecB [Alphaproteobacteria bacterium]|nr:protein-export chaperone SecB [Alphaproteobacteria bacterium]
MAASDSTAPNGDSSNIGADDGSPSLVVAAQYLKDLSFENPRAPQSFGEAGQPQIAVDVNVNARALENSLYEVELSVSANARRGADVLFVVESTYAGAFQIRNVPEEQLEPIMLVECPRLLFPFLRQVIADATRNGNFPPLMLEPIDFFAVYQQRLMQQQAQPDAETASA